VTAEIHALMQYPHDDDAVRGQPIEGRVTGVLITKIALADVIDGAT
jgi:hypothetical protein